VNELPEVTGEATLKEKVKCPHCGKEHEAELTGEVTLEFDMSDYTQDRSWRD
jgi:hypothetical protein